MAPSQGESELLRVTKHRMKAMLPYLLCAVGLIGNAIGLADDNFLLVVDTNNRTIHQIDLSDESILKLPLAEMNYPVAVEFNPTDRKVYWTDLRENIIKSSYLNGTDEKLLTTLHEGSFLLGLAIDMVSGLVYYTEGGADVIAVMTLDGRHQFTLITEAMDKPQDIVLDLPRGMMYWSDSGETPRIEKATMDGRRRSVVIRFEYLAVPLGLAIDDKGRRLFWCDAYLDTIKSVQISDQQAEVIVHVHGSESSYFGIAFLGNQLYFTGIHHSFVSKIALSDAPPTPVQVGPATFNMSSAITAYRRKQRINGYEVNSSCSHSNGGCEQICIATPEGPQCACQDGFVAGKKCSTPTYKCPLEYTGRTGNIRSPGYPKYKNNVFCAMIIRLNNAEHQRRIMRVYVEDIDMPDNNDYLVIQNNKVTGLRVIRYHTFLVSTTQNDMTWLFVTDGSSVGRGFHFKYEVFIVVNCSATRRCQNEGMCTNGEFCKCREGYEGGWCERDVDDCASNPCENGGTCIDKHNGFSCMCATLFTGTVCETDTDTCRSDPCMNEGMCRHQTDSDTYQCLCHDGFSGDVCDHDVDECASNPCENGGTCIDKHNGFSCTCATLFTGTVCETDMDTCRSDPCMNEGMCRHQTDSDTYQCLCHDGFSGDVCDHGLIDSVPAPQKKRLNVTFKLKDAQFRNTLKNKNSKEYSRLRNNVENSLKSILDDKLGRGKYRIADVTFSAGSVVVNCVIEMLKDDESSSSISAAIQQHRGTFAGHELDPDSVVVGPESGSRATPPPDKPFFTSARIGMIGGALAAVAVVCIVVGYYVGKKSRSREPQQEADTLPPPTEAQTLNVYTIDEPQDDYAQLQGLRADDSSHVYGRLNNDGTHEQYNTCMEFNNICYTAGQETDKTYEAICKL